MFRGSRRVFAAFAGLVLWSQPPSAQGVTSPSPSPKEEGGNTANSGENVPLPFPVTVVDSPEQAVANERAEAKSREHDTRDLDAQVRAADAAEKQIPPAWFGAILAFVGTVLLYINLREARKATKAARDAADSAEKTLHSDRAWMTLSTPDIINIANGFVDGELVTETVGFKIGWINSGRSPAINVKCRISSKVEQPDVECPFFNDADVTSPKMAAIGSGQDATTGIVALKGSDFIQFKGRRIDWFVYSRVEYNDIFIPGSTRISECCFLIRYDGERVTPKGGCAINFNITPIGPQNTVG